MVEQCKLCLRYVDKLEDSHFVPKGIYKILRDHGFENPNPWQITRDTAVQVSIQKSAHLLCSECEERFNRNGENWVLRHCLKANGKFSIASTLATITPDMSSNRTDTRVYYASEIPKIDITALSYFAASIFWRGSIYPWNDDGSVPVKLGPFQEPLRQYLMGLESFPHDYALWVIVREGEEISRLTHTPAGRRDGNYHVYNFPMPGLAFSLMVSKNIPDKYRKLCFVHGHKNPLIVTKAVDNSLKDLMVGLVQKNPMLKK